RFWHQPDGLACPASVYSGLILARITLPHFSVSAAMNFPKSGGRTGKGCSTQIGEPRLYLRIGECCSDPLVQLGDDLNRRVLGCADCVPGFGLVARHEFDQAWDIWERVRTHRARHRQSPQPTAPDVLVRCEKT